MLVPCINRASQRVGISEDGLKAVAPFSVELSYRPPPGVEKKRAGPSPRFRMIQLTICPVPRNHRPCLCKKVPAPSMTKFLQLEVLSSNFDTFQSACDGKWGDLWIFLDYSKLGFWMYIEVEFRKCRAVYSCGLRAQAFEQWKLLARNDWKYRHQSQWLQIRLRSSWWLPTIRHENEEGVGD